MGGLKLLVATLVMGSALFPGQAVSQTHTRPPSLIETLNKEAGASDPAGIHKYSQHLVQIILVNGRDPALVASLTDRLEQAELRARQGNRKLIPEEEIAQAFNILLREIGAPTTLTASVDTVHTNRVAFEGALPSVISEKAKGGYCNPGEAVWVVSMLVANVGRPTVPSSQIDNEPHFVVGDAPPVQRHLELFYARHSQSEIVEIFDHLFNHLQI